MEPGTHYLYPHQAAEFGQYNFHRPDIIHSLTSLLIARDARCPRIVELIGAARSGRHYLVRAAAFQAQQQGEPVAVADLDFTGYEPDQPLRQLVQHLAQREEPSRSARISDLAKRAKIELKVTPWNFLCASLGIKWDPSLEELGRLLQSDPRPVGPEMSDREQFRRLLERMTQRQRLVLHARDARTLNIVLRARLVDETILNPKLFLALSYPAGEARSAWTEQGIHRVYVPEWTREEMERTVRGNFRPARIPSEFYDFLWEASRVGRESLASLLLRISQESGLWSVVSVDEKGTWIVEKGWQRNEQLLAELARDLFDPIDQLLQGLPGDERRLVREFLNAAALCDPTVPVKQILALLGLSGDDADGFLDRVDERVGEDGQVPVFLDCGFSNPGFPGTELLYRFRNPALPGVILKRCPDPEDLAVRLLNRLAGELRPDSRSIATLYLRLAETAGSMGEAERYANQLSWWTSLEECEDLTATAVLSMQNGDVSPAAIWKAVKGSERLWPPARRLALLDAYGRQPRGVPAGDLFDFVITKAGLLLDTGDYPAASAEAEMALSLPLPDPRWAAEVRAHNIAGIADLARSRLTGAEAHFESALRLLKTHVELDDLGIVAIQNNLASLHERQGRYEEAEPLYLRALAARERVLGAEHPDTLTSVNDLAGLYERQGRYEEAEPLYLRAVAASERVLGAEHPDTLAAVNNLAGLYWSQGRYEEAEPLHLRALAASERVLGAEHPHTLTAVNNLAGLYESQGRYAEAEPLFQRAVAAIERVLGAEHPHTLTSVHNLAVLYERQGRHEEGDALRARLRAGQSG